MNPTPKHPQCLLTVTHALFVLSVLFSSVLLTTGCGAARDGGIKAPGIVEGEILTLKSSVAGTIEALDLEEGGTVTKNSVPVRIDAAKIRNQLRGLDISEQEITIEAGKVTQKLHYLDSNTAFLRKQVGRFRRLEAKKALPGEKLESMELKLREATTKGFELKKVLEGLEVRKQKIANKREYLGLLLEDHLIRSPINGVVLETFVSAGESVFPGTAVADILDTSSLYIDVFIEGREMAALKPGGTARVRVDGLKDPLEGKIVYFGRKAEFSPKYVISEKERQSLLYRVKITVSDPGGVLKIGMPVTVVFKGEARANATS